MATTPETPRPFTVPEMPAELEALMAGFSDADAGRILRSQRLGYGYLGSDFDSPAAGHVSAVLCHLHRAANPAADDSAARVTYHRDMAAGYFGLALAEADAAAAAQGLAPSYPGARSPEFRSFAVCTACGFTSGRHAAGCAAVAR